MFKGNQSGKEARGAGDSGAINTIVAGTVIEGNVVLQGSIRFDGHLKGTLESKGRVVIGNSGVIEGNIFCNDADIAGKVKGNITSTELTRLAAGSSIIGDIRTGQLAIEPGAQFSGNCSMSGDKANTLQQTPKRNVEQIQ